MGGKTLASESSGAGSDPKYQKKVGTGPALGNSQPRGPESCWRVTRVTRRYRRLLFLATETKRPQNVRENARDQRGMTLLLPSATLKRIDSQRRCRLAMSTAMAFGSIAFLVSAPSASVSPALRLFPTPPSRRRLSESGVAPARFLQNKEPRQASGCPIMGRQRSSLASPGFGALPSPEKTG